MFAGPGFFTGCAIARQSGAQTVNQAIFSCCRMRLLRPCRAGSGHLRMWVGKFCLFLVCQAESQTGQGTNRKENKTLAGFLSRNYYADMKYLAILGFVCLAAASGCGPREIGQGSSTAQADIGPSVAENMRLPMTGAGHTQQMLYYYNRPDVMQRVQAWRWSEANRLEGEQPAPADSLAPRQSPFRQ